MAINDQNKLDLLWKRYAYGVTETTATNKAAIEESIVSNHIVLPGHIWSEANNIPVPAGALASVVYSETNGVPLIKDATVPSGQTWLAVRDSGIGPTSTNRLRDWIPGFVDPSYEVMVYKDANFIEANRLLPGTDGQEWIFDYSAGVLYFPNGLPAGVTSLFLLGYRYIGKKGVGSTQDNSNTDNMLIGTPTIGDFSNGYLHNIVPHITSIADAVEYINRALNDFTPIQPPGLSAETPVIALDKDGKSITVKNTLLSSGALINFATFSDQIQPGQPITTITTDVLNSDWVGPFGPANYGTLELWYNFTDRKTGYTLTVDNDQGVFGYLELEGESPYPPNSASRTTSLRARIKDMPVDSGYNLVKITNTATGETPPLHFVYDSSTNIPKMKSADVFQGYTTPALQWSSGVPHYNINNKLQFMGTAQDCVTDAYLQNGIFEIDSNPQIFNHSLLTVGMNGIPTVLTKGQDVSFTEFDIIMQPPDASARLFLDGSASLLVRGNSAHANGLWYTLEKRINVMYGNRNQTETLGPVRELRVPITTDLGSRITGGPEWAARIYMSEDDTPADEITLTESDFKSENALPAHEAAVVGGVIRCDRRNYTQNWLPVGPDYSNKPNTQWITFMLRRKNVSMMRIEVDGSYSGIWVKLPGIEGLNNAPNGWLRANAYYNGYGTPGIGANSNGCAMTKLNTGYSDVFDITFGDLSSSLSTNNIILVRFRLEELDEIRGLRFSSVPR